MRISAFMHGRRHLKLAKKLNDKIPTKVDEMFKRFRAFIRGEVAARSAELARAPQWDKGTTRPRWSRGQERRQIEEAVASGKLAHLVKDIHRGNQKNESQGRGGMKVINTVGIKRSRKRPYEMEKPRRTEEITFPAIPQNNLIDAPIILEGTIKGYHVRRIYIDGGSSSKIMYEHCFKNFDTDIKSRLRKSNAPLVEVSCEIYHPLGLIDLKVTIREPGRSKIMLLEFAIVKCRSPYNVIMGRTSMRSLEVVEEMQSSWKETQWRQHMEQMSRIREKAILQARSIPSQRLGKEPVMLKETWEEDTMQMDNISLNKVCTKDMYPFPKTEEELGSLMGYKYKCFSRLPKEHSQVRMSEIDEEKIGFHTEEGVYCFTHMLKGLKNSTATLQRMMDKVLADQKGRNLEVYLEEIVMKSKTEQNLIKDVEETFIPKLVELMLPIRNIRRSLDAAEVSDWIIEAEEAFQG
ncbi:hypothetical protein Tco_0885949 [Tanacetum coccineum]